MEKYKVNLFYDNNAKTLKEILEEVLESYFNEVYNYEIWYN